MAGEPISASLQPDGRPALAEGSPAVKKIKASQANVLEGAATAVLKQAAIRSRREFMGSILDSQQTVYKHLKPSHRGGHLVTLPGQSLALKKTTAAASINP